MYTKVVLSIVVCIVAQSMQAGLLGKITDLVPKVGVDVNVGGLKANADLGVDLGNLGASADVGVDLGGLGAKADLGVDLGNLEANAGLGVGLGDLGAKADLGIDLGDLNANVGLGVDLGNLSQNYSQETIAQDILNLQLQVVINSIDGYLPVEYVDPIDDSLSFGELTLTEQDLSGPSNESILSDLLDRCKALLKIIKDYIASKVSGVINTIGRIDVSARVIIEAGANSFKRKLGAVVEKAREGIRKKIAELKQNVGQCLNNSEQQFRELLSKFIISETKCVTVEFHKAFDIARNAKNAILGSIKTIETLPGEIVNCLKGDNKLSCIKNDIWDVAKAQEQYLKNFVAQFFSAASFVTGFESRVATCALNHLELAGRTSLNIVQRFPQCVLGKTLA